MNVDGIEIPREVEAEGLDAIAAYIAEQQAARTAPPEASAEPQQE